jgi:hypothetical protein
MTMTAEETIERLTKEIGALQQSNLALQDQVGRAIAPPKSPDDVAAALQRTVDGLQTKLASLSNPISNFAVKEFRLETNLTVSITDLGTLEYRLLQPGANVDPNSISKLTLSLVPIEKQVPQGTFAPLAFEPQKELAAIGVGDDLRQLLEENHIFTIGEFRSAAMRVPVRASLVASGKTTQQELAQLQALAELALLSGVDVAIAKSLIAAKIDSLQAVARSTADGLMLIVDVERADAERWIAAAQSFTGVSETTQRVIRLDTDPPGLFVRFGSEPWTNAPVVRQFPIRQQISATTLRAQLIGRIGYATPSSGVAFDEKNVAIAKFGVACYSVVAATASAGGKITIEPAVGGVRGFPANCYAPGTPIELVVEPEDGFTLRELTITTGATTRTVTALRTPLVVNAPIVAHAVFGRRSIIIEVKPPVA